MTDKYNPDDLKMLWHRIQAMLGDDTLKSIIQSPPRNDAFCTALDAADPPPLSWSTHIVSKGGPSNGYQETSSGRDCYKITSG